MDLTKRLEKCYAAAVHDVLRGMGYAQCVLPHTIKPLDPAKKLAGRSIRLAGISIRPAMRTTPWCNGPDCCLRRRRAR
jgi:hypothetical protein